MTVMQVPYQLFRIVDTIVNVFVDAIRYLLFFAVFFTIRFFSLENRKCLVPS